MKINELRIGNLIKVNPRENQEGLLAITEIQKETVIGEMISPRAGYHFRLQFDEIVFIPINEEWLTKLGFSKPNSSDENWQDSRGLFDFHFTDDYDKFLVEDSRSIGIRPIENVHDLQNVYFFLTGEELSGSSE